MNFSKQKEINSHLTPVRVIVFGYFTVIMTGTLLLMLPFATRADGSEGFMTALFTATTSTCVTGLVVADTYSNWTQFGQTVILVLIQIGGLGFMTIATLMSFIVRRNISLRERVIMANAYNLPDLSGVVRITRNVIIGTFCIETLGAVLLSFRLVPQFGWAGGIWKSIFTSISAFCNAGIDLFGEIEPYTSITSYRGDWLVNLTIMGLIVIGGLGFIVWEEVIHRRSFRKYSLYTKLVLATTALLIVGGALSIYLFEMNNPDTFMNMSPNDQVLASFFQSVTCRTAGFNSMDLNTLTGASKAIMCGLMFIGGSSGSTAGGIKTVTFVILIFMTINALRGRKEIVIRNRRVNADTMFKAVAVAGVSLAALALGVLAILYFDPQFTIGSVIYECTSALATVGCTLGITPHTGLVARLILIMLMFFGRVGILTLGLSLVLRSDRDKFKVLHTDGKFLVG